MVMELNAIGKILILFGSILLLAGGLLMVGGKIHGWESFRGIYLYRRIILHSSFR